MAIDLALFKKAQAPLVERVRNFLKEGKGKAFSISEIVSGVEGVDSSSALILFAVDRAMAHAYQEALEEIVQVRPGDAGPALYARASHGGNTYYAYVG